MRWLGVCALALLGLLGALVRYALHQAALEDPAGWDTDGWR